MRGGCPASCALCALSPPSALLPHHPLQAVAAINAFNGRQVGPSKRLVIKFADQKAAAA
jgi:hypothetical protein